MLAASCKCLRWRAGGSCARHTSLCPLPGLAAPWKRSATQRHNGLIDPLLTSQQRAWACNAQGQHTSSSTPKQPPRFYAQPHQLPSVVGGTMELEPEEARHAIRVLRLKPGDAVELCDGRGRLVAAEIVHAHQGSAMVAATAAPQLQPWRGPKWVMAVGCLSLKGGRTDWLVEKCTELGAHAVLPLITERSQAAGKNKFRTSSSGAKTQKASSSGSGDSDGYQPGRLERLAIAATKQSLRVHALDMQPPVAVHELLPLVTAAPLSLVATAGAPALLDVLASAAASKSVATLEQQACYLIVGPEGDFTAEELQALQQAGAQPVGLGAHRLRTETAAIALLSGAMLWAER